MTQLATCRGGESRADPKPVRPTCLFSLWFAAISDPTDPGPKIFGASEPERILRLENIAGLLTLWP